MVFRKARSVLIELPSFVIPRRKIILISSCPKQLSRNRPFKVALYKRRRNPGRRAVKEGR
jgi:hypothetical protein